MLPKYTDSVNFVGELAWLHRGQGIDSSCVVGLITCKSIAPRIGDWIFILCKLCGFKSSRTACPSKWHDTTLLVGVRGICDAPCLHSTRICQLLEHWHDSPTPLSTATVPKDLLEIIVFDTQHSAIAAAAAAGSCPSHHC